ncbi:MAG: DUF2946 domain-containing protein [Methylophilus sp.]|nr:DUF2946 domain-containing protein [Methylophilus sp.]
MMSQKLFRWMHRIALIAMVFASLAPSVSHALAGQGSASGFMQEICGTGGKKLFIQVVTTHGQQLQASFDIKPSNQSKSISQHMHHCPFCHAGVADIAMPVFNPAFALYLEAIAQAQAFHYVAPVSSPPVQASHLSRAPPVLL